MYKRKHFINNTNNLSKIFYTSNFTEIKDFFLFHNYPLTNLSNYTWYFDQISGNNFSNIFLTLNSYSNINANSKIFTKGILKFNGYSFDWIVEPFKTNDPYFYLIFTEPNSLLITNSTSLFSIKLNPHF